MPTWRGWRRPGLRRRLGDGDVIIREGESTDSLIFVLEGELLVTTRRLGQIARLGVGEVVGEISLVDLAPPSATITASGTGLALFLDKTKLMRKLETMKALATGSTTRSRCFLPTGFEKRAEARPESAISDEAGSRQDELDIGILDRVSPPENDLAAC